MNFSRFVQFAPALAGVFFCALLLGCATPQVTQLHARQAGTELAQKAQISDIKFFAQREYECGPAALAMLLSATGLAITPDELVDQVYLPARKGSLQVEMLAATRQRGLLAYTLQPFMHDLLQEVAAGHPVLVFQNVSLPVYPVWHYAAVIGYDLERNTLTLHSGETARMEMSLYTFERTWARGNYWAMLALPPGQLPATADANSLARSAAALEANQPQAARATYAAALSRWPADATLHFGLANSVYAQHDLQAAAASYRQAVALQPAFADAWNNLAQVQLELGNPKDAAQAVAQAVALGGARLAQYLELQARIQDAAVP